VPKICSVSGCDNKYKSNGFCSKHVQAWRKYDDPLGRADPKETKIKQSKPKSPSHKVNLSKSLKGNTNKKGKKVGPIHSDEFKADARSRWTGEGNPSFGGLSPQRREDLSVIQKKRVTDGTYTSPMEGKTHSDVAKKKNADKHRHPASAKTKAKMKKTRNTKKGKENAKKGWRAMRKSTVKPNKQETAIGEILSGIGIKCKLLQNVHYTTLDNKSDSKEMDIVWKDSMGNKKIIEYNGRYHFDSREHKPDEYVIVHNEFRKCQDIWDEENMILNQIRKEGYEILVVWQLDWKKERDKTTKKILKFAKLTGG